MNAEGMEYDASHIEVLEGWEAVRKRPGMYVGSTGQRGLYQLVLDVVDRAVTEVLAGRAGSVDVTLTADGGVRVADDGPGGGGPNGPDLEAQLTSFQFGSGPIGRRTAVLAPLGMGPFVANALSSRLTAEVRGEGTRWVKEYARGVEVEQPDTEGPLTGDGGSATGRGTTISFWPDTEIFETTWCAFPVLAERFRQLAFLNRGLVISLTDERPANGVRRVLFQFPDGVRDFVAALDAEAGACSHADVFGFEREDKRMAGTMEVALLWGYSRGAQLRGFANSLATHGGGTHLDGFRKGVVDAVTTFARERELPGASDLDACADGIVEGLTAVVSVKLDQPEYLGATCTLLGNTEVRLCVAEAVREHLGTWFEERPERAADIVAGIVRDISQD
ncbi:DNA gyrase subunit B [Streptomyces sp. NBC_00986]|uniref:DNA gyrase subunit B n=1 Tax=Streptomyces sp. NBC_00986 TaxID=2903702 RepID=UPI003869AFAF|nr:DNA gyrase subunit B [Streptomyces sp. NBC_00986]